MTCSTAHSSTYYENGKKETDMNYKDGALDGKKMQWDEKGRKTAEASYEKGNLVEGKFF